jgi:hypothetical protein
LNPRLFIFETFWPPRTRSVTRKLKNG